MEPDQSCTTDISVLVNIAENLLEQYLDAGELCW